MISQEANQLALNNQIFLEQVDAALINAHLPPNILRNMILNVNKALECDSECQKRRLIDDLKIKWDTAKKTEATIEQNVAQARKNYITAAESDSYYTNNILIPEFKKEIDKIISNDREKLTEIKHTNRGILDAYTVAYTSLTKLKQLFGMTKDENKELKSKIDNKINYMNTEERRVWYKFQSIDRQEFYNKIIRIAYYVVISIFAIIQLFIKKNYKNLHVWSKLLFLALFPYILIYLVKGLFKVVFYIRMYS